MNENEPKEPIAFDEIVLKSDAPIQREEKPPVKRGQPKPRRSGLAVLFFILFLGAGAGAWYFYDQHRQLEVAFNNLLQEQDSTRLNLNETAGTLEEAHASITLLNKDLASAKKENETLASKNKNLDNTVAKNNKEIKALRTEIDKRKAEQSKTNEKLKDLENSKAALQKSFTQLEQRSSSEIKSLETRLQEKESQYQADADAWNKSRNTLQQNLQKANEEKERIQRQFDDESKASLKIIQEQASLKENGARLESEVRKLKAELKAAQTKVNALENVQPGDLVPYSEEIKIGDIRYREPLAEGVKIPRKTGQVAIQVLINEVGSVEKAFIIPDQLLEADLSRALIQSIYKWKFTPPTYRNIRVKTWQTVLVKSE